MTKAIDRAFVSLGVDAQDLSDFRGRSVIYAGLVMMGIASTALAASIVLNLMSSGSL